MSRAETTGRHLILYDGVCGLCNRLNQFVLRRDHRAIFRFASLQSGYGQAVLRQFGRDTANLDTLYVIANHAHPDAALFAKSTAALFVLRELGGVWRWLAALRVLPRWLLDWGYDRIATNRYSVFGRYDACALPPPAWRDRFLDA